MAYFDLPLDQLWSYCPPQTWQPDCAQFWRHTLAEAVEVPLAPQLVPLDLPYTGVQLFRATFAGWQGAEVVGTYARPLGDGPFPALLLYHGYSSRRPEAFDLLGWTSQSYAVLAIDIRGQSGESSDTGSYPGGHAPGYMTIGVGDPRTYYYRAVYVDALRAVELLTTRPEVDPERLGIAGGSQGGGLTLATAALWPLRAQAYQQPVYGRVRAAFAEIPFLCHFERGATLTDAGPYQEIAHYCRRSGVDPAQVFRTLSYFDCMNLAHWIEAPVYLTAGLMDLICPPSTIFAAYNHIRAPKEIFVAQFGEHEIFPGVPDMRARWFATHL